MVSVYREDREAGCLGNFMNALINETNSTDVKH